MSNNKVSRYYVFFQPPADEIDNAVQNNYVSYNAKVDNITIGGKRIASAKAHAIFAGRINNGNVFVQYEGDNELYPLKPTKTK